MEDTFRTLENLISAVLFGHPDDVESKQIEHFPKQNEELQAKKTD